MDKVSCLNGQLTRKAPIELPDKPLKFGFSKMGGDDVARGAEWFQAQWKKALGINIELQAEEQISYLQTLRKNPPDIFRKGVGLERPTCLAAIEIFSRGHPENYIGLDDPVFESWLTKLKRASRETERKKLCRQTIEYLLSTHRLIPLGEMYFTLVASPKYAGWTLNSLNQLDLSQLHRL